jgi:hypothetical protein
MLFLLTLIPPSPQDFRIIGKLYSSPQYTAGRAHVFAGILELLSQNHDRMQ